MADTKYETKPLTLMQRAEINDLIAEKKSASASVLACKYGLKSLNGIELNLMNIEDEVNKLTMNEILEIGAKIYVDNETNKKK